MASLISLNISSDKGCWPIAPSHHLNQCRVMELKILTSSPETTNSYKLRYGMKVCKVGMKMCNAGNEHSDKWFLYFTCLINGWIQFDFFSLVGNGLNAYRICCQNHDAYDTWVNWRCWLIYGRALLMMTAAYVYIGSSSCLYCIVHSIISDTEIIILAKSYIFLLCLSPFYNFWVMELACK